MGIGHRRALPRVHRRPSGPLSAVGCPGSGARGPIRRRDHSPEGPEVRAPGIGSRWRVGCPAWWEAVADAGSAKFVPAMATVSGIVAPPTSEVSTCGLTSWTVTMIKQSGTRWSGLAFRPPTYWPLPATSEALYRGRVAIPPSVNLPLSPRSRLPERPSCVALPAPESLASRSFQLPPLACPSPSVISQLDMVKGTAAAAPRPGRRRRPRRA